MAKIRETTIVCIEIRREKILSGRLLEHRR